MMLALIEPDART